MKLSFVSQVSLIVAVLVLMFAVLVQGGTIRKQERLIRDMVKNPQCLVPGSARSVHNEHNSVI